MEKPTNYGTVAISEAHDAPFETWENLNSENTAIHIEHPEFSSLCPRSGYPDTGTIIIDYIPNKLLVELKSVKLYLNSFRHIPTGHEKAVNTIYRKLNSELAPKHLRVIGDFYRRGGVKTVVSIPAIGSVFPEYKHNLL